MQLSPSLCIVKCDGCGKPATPEHIRRRIERLELASRYRPIHIHVLLLDLAPPARLEDFFYWIPNATGERSSEGQTRFEKVLAPAGIGENLWKDPQAALAEFQRGNYFLTTVTECPTEADGMEGSNGDFAKEIVRVHGPTLLKRLQFSLKPKRVEPIGNGAPELKQILRKSGWGESARR